MFAEKHTPNVGGQHTWSQRLSLRRLLDQKVCTRQGEWYSTTCHMQEQINGRNSATSSCNIMLDMIQRWFWKVETNNARHIKCDTIMLDQHDLYLQHYSAIYLNLNEYYVRSWHHYHIILYPPLISRDPKKTVTMASHLAPPCRCSALGDPDFNRGVRACATCELCKPSNLEWKVKSRLEWWLMMVNSDWWWLIVVGTMICCDVVHHKRCPMLPKSFCAVVLFTKQ